MDGSGGHGRGGGPLGRWAPCRSALMAPPRTRVLSRFPVRPRPSRAPTTWSRALANHHHPPLPRSQQLCRREPSVSVPRWTPSWAPCSSALHRHSTQSLLPVPVSPDPGCVAAGDLAASALEERERESFAVLRLPRCTSRKRHTYRYSPRTCQSVCAGRR